MKMPQQDPSTGDVVNGLVFSVRVASTLLQVSAVVAFVLSVVDCGGVPCFKGSGMSGAGWVLASLALSGWLASWALSVRLRDLEADRRAVRGRSEYE